MPRRYSQYPACFSFWHKVSSYGYLLSFASFLFFFYLNWHALYYRIPFAGWNVPNITKINFIKISASTFIKIFSTTSLFIITKASKTQERLVYWVHLKSGFAPIVFLSRAKNFMESLRVPYNWHGFTQNPQGGTTKTYANRHNLKINLKIKINKVLIFILIFMSIWVFINWCIKNS